MQTLRIPIARIPATLLLTALAGASATAQDRPKLAQPMLLPQAVVLPKGDREVTIDGSLTDWPRLPVIRLDDRRQLSGTAHGAWRGPADASAVVFLMWDEQALYVACVAHDEWHRALDANTLLLTEIPAADSLLLSFDPDRNTRSNGPDPGRREDREFWLADEEGHEVVQWDRLRGLARVLDAPARMVVLHSKEEQLTTFEALIPWNEILPPGQHAQVGRCIDLQMIFNDFDESTDSMPQTRLGWTFGMGPKVDPGLLGSIMLVADDAALAGVMPEFPPKPGVSQAPVEPPDYWRRLTADLLQRPPQIYDGTLTPAETGGAERFSVLERIDRHCAEFPRVDFLELHQRIARRMSREVAGLMARGLPSWWRDRLHAVSKQGEDPVPPGALRFFRLPMGGWLVRNTGRNYLIDPAGNDVAQWLWGGAGMVLLTQPLDMTRRNDQLLIRMFVAKPPRPVYSHIVYHLPLIAMAKMPLVELGREYGKGTGTLVYPLGVPGDDGSVPYDCSYRIETDGCAPVLVVGPTMPAALAPEKAGGVLLASPRNRHIVDIANRVAPDLILLDDAFLPQAHPHSPRITLRNLHDLQRSLLPHRSVLLAPGESWTVLPQSGR